MTAPLSPRPARPDDSEVGTAHATSRPARPRRQRDGEDALDQYFRDMGAYPLISPDEEAALARRIRVGDQGALDKLVCSNLRFVVSVAKKYQNQGVSLSDLISEGNLGLIRAAHRFDETKGIRFISYAIWYVRQAILEGLAEQSRTVRVPLHQIATLHRIGKRANTLLQELGREATHAEIAEGMHISAVEVSRLVAAAQPLASLDAPATVGAGDGLLNHLPDTQGLAPDAPLLQRMLAEGVSAALGGLRVREARILRLYFGLDGEDPLSLEQIGALLGITRERVRQIKETALARLRHTIAGRSLAHFRA
ncbi:RNA polymerase sigma factor RpoD/SigA [Roseisolibacter sp. H3M3-2]|uniref:sigma-70 family RNA polymerase sigma factor n=1 Tax=Roseisolibacter sp. H3M3-2 TaxID=3031323 RepID=UPI0023DADB29|nr:RNA polymerase sigma factor RpoD/SigA [Roseisolibacter sp. H3M3-2]MDF1501362.1 RNA polymerase sigma factor RpoD/SigA [Roseisolibacter sp. H3M3-2]